MDSNKNLEAKKQIKKEFNLHKYNKLIENVDDFFEATDKGKKFKEKYQTSERTQLDIER